ncbi:23S rRNA (cytidine(2498)-2'-O)-methyltransferase RlmM [Methylolobus aquaticus]|nr:23S rRNA (cytidine(2498)-2'-O)-methyltransferase RlmM [Methylolobus aquaticus]
MNSSLTPTTHALLLYCRAGFEKECAAEISAFAHRDGQAGYAKTSDGSGFVVFHPHETSARVSGAGGIAFDQLIFARQLIQSASLTGPLPPEDRITPLLEQALSVARRFSGILLETADTNEAKALSTFTRKLAVPLRRAAEGRNLIAGGSQLPRLHLFFLSATEAYVGLSLEDNGSPWPMGIPRLKFPRGAPSRSTLKLEEALLTFLERAPEALQPGMTAVDLGAAPGGWTWQLVRRHLRVTAVDNGPIQAELLDSGLVEHRRTDAFRFRPAKPVDWMVCDVVEQPIRIAQLVARWLAEGWCRHCIFNLKLPMKKRRDEVLRCQELIATTLEDAGCPYRLRIKQLYHDREEVTGYLQRLPEPGTRSTKRRG